MRIRYASDDEFVYSKFPTAKSVEDWCLLYANCKPLQCIGQDTSWHVEWQMVQRFSPEPILDDEVEVIQ